jgi:hypothetical protein
MLSAVVVVLRACVLVVWAVWALSVTDASEIIFIKDLKKYDLSPLAVVLHFGFC